jgi:hypothetical protein
MGAALTRKMVLELYVLRASGSVACPRRPCEREVSFFCRARKRQWRKPLPGSQRTWDSPAVGVLGRVVYGRCPECRPAAHLGQSPPGVERVAGRTIDERVKWVGSWVGGFEVGLANLSRRQVRPQGNPRLTAWSTPRRLSGKEQSKKAMRLRLRHRSSRSCP